MTKGEPVTWTRRALLGRAAEAVGAVALGAVAGGVEPASALAQAPPPTSAPSAFAALPRAGLWTTPTAFAPAPTAAAALGLTGGLWLARDDLGGTLFGGGKARKLDLLLGEALARGARGVATTGGVGSNHARSTAWAARHLGLECHLALLPEPPSSEARRNLAAMEAAGAHVTIGGPSSVRRLADRAATSGGALAWIPMGGTSPRGDLAFVGAAFELARAVAAGTLPAPATITLALGSGGSAVGLAIGLECVGLPTRVIAVRCSSPTTSSEAVLTRAVAATSRRVDELWPGAPAPDALARGARGRIEIDGAELGAGYARPTIASTRAAERVLAQEGVRLDSTYAAKAVASVVRRAASLGREPTLVWLGCDARWLAGGASISTSHPRPGREG